MSNLQAAVGLAQVERFDDLLKRQQVVDKRYCRGLSDVPGIHVPGHRARVRPVRFLFPVLLAPRIFGMGRSALMRALAVRGIETRPLYYPLHRMPPYRRPERFPVAERIAPRGLCLPSGPSITDDQIDTVIEAIRHVQRQDA